MSKPFASPPLIFLSPPTNLQPTTSNLDNKISPSILLIIIILAIIFFVSGLLHLLVRYLIGATQRDPDDITNVTAFQGQLRQLFHLHDSGVDQSYIDTLPVFHYKAIIGVKDPFDCAVCLCEFEADDKLRLLPKCSHAFHMECIDTWLLSHSTCPLCRSSLLLDYSYGNNPIPIVCVLESGSGENSSEIPESVLDTDSRMRINRNVEFGSMRIVEERKSSDQEKNVMVKLGKFKSGEGSSDENGNEKLGSRRCYSMGSYAYVLDEGMSLQVPFKTLMKKKCNKKIGSNRGAMSEYGSDSRREFNFRSVEFHTHANGNRKRDSFSVSKRTISEIEIEEGEIEKGDEETQSNYSVESIANSNSHRRTLLWLMGRHNKVVHNHSSSMSSIV